MGGSVFSKACPALRTAQCSFPEAEKSRPAAVRLWLGAAVRRHGAQGSWAHSTGKSPAVLLGLVYSWRFLGNLPGLCLAITGFSVETVGKKQSSVGETKAKPRGDPERENSEILHPSSSQQRCSRLILYCSWKNNELIILAWWGFGFSGFLGFWFCLCFSFVSF